MNGENMFLYPRFSEIVGIECRKPLSNTQNTLFFVFFGAKFLVCGYKMRVAGTLYLFSMKKTKKPSEKAKKEKTC